MGAGSPAEIVQEWRQRRRARLDQPRRRNSSTEFAGTTGPTIGDTLADLGPALRKFQGQLL